MAERIIYGLEFIDIQEQHRKLAAIAASAYLVFETLEEQSPVWQISQRVVMSQSDGPFFGSAPLRHILDRGHPAALGKRLVDDLHPSSVGNGCDVTGDFAEPACLFDHLAVFIDIAAECSVFFSMLDDVSQETARLDRV